MGGGLLGRLGASGGHWDGDVDTDCDNCFNDIDIDRDKFIMNDVDWKNVDRSKIKFDKNQFANIDRAKFRNAFKANRNNNIANRAKDVSRDRRDMAGRPAKVSVGRTTGKILRGDLSEVTPSPGRSRSTPASECCSTTISRSKRRAGI
ncbi:hypothetical protein [Sinorhizobium meliloti]|uniref:hypothetical protein n=1 Tax=Rhizobium meliloti TaxID=382 RepID=UPI001F3CD9A3|nr:hypothetical protein [Sinorhizobium meliloti]